MKRVIDSWVLARSDRAGSWRVFLEALKSDLADIQGGITRRGYPPRRHGRTVDLVQRGYTEGVTVGVTRKCGPGLPRQFQL
jgi:alpha,alpha-trehalase